MNRKAVSGIMLTLLLVSMLTLAFGVQLVEAQETVRFYVKDPTDGDNIYAGKPVGATFPVQVWIDSPASWSDTSDGIVAYTISVQVDPTVLKVVGATKVPDLDGFLEKFAAEHGRSTLDAPECVDPTNGTIWGFAEAIVGWVSLGVGAGGTAPLMYFWFTSKSDTMYSPIDLIEEGVIEGITIDARYTNARGETHYPDVIEDGHYACMPTPPVEDTEAYMEYVNETIQDLPDDILDRPEEDVPDVKNDFSDLFNDALENIDEADYEGAMEKLNRIKEMIYEQMLESDEREELISLIDHLIAYLETLL